MKPPGTRCTTSTRLGLGVVGAEDPFAVGQGPLEQIDGLVEPARIAMSGGEIFSGGYGVRVVGPQDYLALGEVLLEQIDGPVESPHREASIRCRGIWHRVP